MAVNIKKMTDGLGADICIDCEVAGNFGQALAGVRLKPQGGGAMVLHWCTNSVCEGGTVSIASLIMARIGCNG